MRTERARLSRPADTAADTAKAIDDMVKRGPALPNGQSVELQSVAARGYSPAPIGVGKRRCDVYP